MNQRVVIAMALAKDPTLLILDEPTTGLDATVEAEVLDLVAALRDEFGTSVLFISHSLDVIARMCDRVGVLYAGPRRRGGHGRRGLQQPAPPLHGRAAALHPARRRDEGQGPARHDPGLPARASAPSCPGCVFADRCGLAAGHLPREGAGPVRASAATHRSRCHFHEKAQALPRAEAAAPVKTDAVERRPDADPAHAQSVRKTFHQEGHDVRAVEDLDVRARRRARRSGSSASRAAARRRSRGCCSG